MKVAVLDLNNNVTNRGIGYLKRMLETYNDTVSYEVFDVRHKNEVPGLEYDIYILSGGPGSPYDYAGGWDEKFFALIQALYQHNLQHKQKKFVFFICHSFQLACLHFKIGTVSERKHGQSFGTFPCFSTPQGEHDKYLKKLSNPFWIADFRDWQVVLNEEQEKSNDERMDNIGHSSFKILAYEPVQKSGESRAIMAIRFSDYMFGTQFHPEADAEGMSAYFSDASRRETVVKNFGEDKYNQMITDLNDPDKIQYTFKTLLPTFMEDAIMHFKTV